jgi:hypothetical protein
MTMRQGKVPDAIWSDELVQRYAREGSFGYLHHAARTDARDRLVAKLMTEAGYSHEEAVGALVSVVGRWIGDTLEEPRPRDIEIVRAANGALGYRQLTGMAARRKRLAALLSMPQTRRRCVESARAYADEVAACARVGTVRFTCPEHGDTAVYSPQDGEAYCEQREEVLDLQHPDVQAAIKLARVV